MKLRTTFDIPSFQPKITYKSRIFTMGSCFSTMLSDKLLQRKFKVLNNPFGTIYNPVSLFQLLTQSLMDQQPDADLVLEQQQRFYHYGLHSSVSTDDKDQLWAKIKTRQNLARDCLSKSSHIFFTDRKSTRLNSSHVR